MYRALEEALDLNGFLGLDNTSLQQRMWGRAARCVLACWRVGMLACWRVTAASLTFVLPPR